MEEKEHFFKKITTLKPSQTVGTLEMDEDED